MWNHWKSWLWPSSPTSRPHSRTKYINVNSLLIIPFSFCNHNHHCFLCQQCLCFGNKNVLICPANKADWKMGKEKKRVIGHNVSINRRVWWAVRPPGGGMMQQQTDSPERQRSYWGGGGGSLQPPHCQSPTESRWNWWTQTPWRREETFDLCAVCLLHWPPQPTTSSLNFTLHIMQPTYTCNPRPCRQMLYCTV